MHHLERLAARSDAMGRTVWIDMESTAYVDGTIELYRELLARPPTSAYVCRPTSAAPRTTSRDWRPSGPTIRLVKGAYREPKEHAFQDKRLIEESFFRLAQHLADERRDGSP